jgi:uncharacterized membrane protein YeaQ/YmgE (transglycosylase-associated protein family)
MISLLGFVVIGLLVATIAKALVPGRDPGMGITILLGAAAQVTEWALGRLAGWNRFGQPWSFFLSIAAAAVLLYFFRETGLDERLARPSVATAPALLTRSADPAAQDDRSLWARVASACAWAAGGAVMLGMTGFVIGFFGPMQLQPGSNQGPMLGIFVTGPAGVLLGGVAGGWLRMARPDWPMRWRLWGLNIANVAYGLFVLDVVADPWWH